MNTENIYKHIKLQAFLTVTVSQSLTQTGIHSFLPHLSANQLQQGAVDGQQVDVGADRRLIKGTGLAVQFV